MQLAGFREDEVVEHQPEEGRCDQFLEVLEVRKGGVAIELVSEVYCREVVVMVDS